MWPLGLRRKLHGNSPPFFLLIDLPRAFSLLAMILSREEAEDVLFFLTRRVSRREPFPFLQVDLLSLFF